MKILVTGATGFIGKHLIIELVSKSHKVRCLVRKTSRKEDVNYLKKLKVGLVYANLVEQKMLKNIANNIDVVIHLAGIGNINAVSHKYYLQYKKINVVGTENLLEECKKAKVKKFIHFSSIAAMGLIKKIGKINVNDCCKPETPYEKSKYESELVVKKSHIPYIILRPPMVHDWKHPNKEIEKLVKFIKFGVVPVIGKGDKKIAMIHINNLVNATVSIINNNVKNKIYIINDKKLYTLNELIFILSKSLNKNPFVVHIPVWLIKILVKLMELLARIFGFIPSFTSKRIESMITDKIYDNSGIIE